VSTADRALSPLPANPVFCELSSISTFRMIPPSLDATRVGSTFERKRMSRLFYASFAYMIAGVLSGLFYREFTKLNDFPAGQFTQLGLAHTHLLTLGFIVLLIVLVLEKTFTLSQSRLFGWFFWL
jgi:hypothetical protein